MKTIFLQKLAVCGGLLLFATIIERHRLPLVAAEPQPQSAAEKDVTRLKSIATDQSHVMADVGYHFANLWFAGEKRNWPLAKFYLDETRSHLRWAVRVIPVRVLSPPPPPPPQATRANPASAARARSGIQRPARRTARA